MNLAIASKAIYNLLLNDPTISGIVGNKIFPTISEEGTESPFIVYIERLAEPLITKEGSFERDYVLIEILSVAKSFLESRAIGDAAQVLLNGYKGTVAGVRIDNTIYVERLLPQFDDERTKLWVDNQRYQVWIYKQEII